jgi:hypothetical protein
MEPPEELTAEDADKATTSDLIQVPGYRTQQFLDRGGMGTVYLVEDETLGRLVALKIINPQFSNDRSFADRFQREARIIAQFQHLNIVTIHASGRHNDMQFIVMEYVAGGTLRHRINRGPLPQEEAAKIARATAEALRYSHQRDIIHRDFKPSNILLRTDGTPVLSDFGIARSASVPNGNTVTGAVIGDQRYMGPERLLGQSASDRTDIYSFGLVFFEMLTGRPPPERYIQSDHHVKPIEAALRGVDARYVRLICDCLQFAPEQRPSAEECVARLEQKAVPAPRSKIPMVFASLGLAMIGIAAGGLIVNGLMNKPASAVPLRVSPSLANVYVDGIPSRAPVMPLDGKMHEIGVVSPGFLGELLVTKDTPTTITLEPMSMPSLAEHRAFARQFFRGESSADGVPITHAPLRTLLQLKAASGAERDREAQKIRRLAELGDPASQWAAFVASREKLLPLDDTASLAFLKSAMGSGYALATFYYALYQLDVAGDRLKSDAAAYAEFTSTLARARQQGLVDIVDDYERALRGSS